MPGAYITVLLYYNSRYQYFSPIYKWGNQVQNCRITCHKVTELLTGRTTIDILLPPHCTCLLCARKHAQEGAVHCTTVYSNKTLLVSLSAHWWDNEAWGNIDLEVVTWRDLKNKWRQSKWNQKHRKYNHVFFMETSTGHKTVKGYTGKIPSKFMMFISGERNGIRETKARTCLSVMIY